MSASIQFLRSRNTWLVLFIAWAVLLFLLSSLSKTMPEGGPEIPHIDKVMHFGYFFGGGIILGTWSLLRKTDTSIASLPFVVSFLVLASVGALDEYHQTFTPGRSGNDPFDWMADVLGSAFGLVLANLLHPFILKLSSLKPGNWKI